MSSEKKKPSDSAKSKGSEGTILGSRSTSNIGISDNHNITYSNDVQEFFSELEEFENKFTPKHQNSILLSESFYRLGETKKAERIRECGSYLQFAHDIDQYGEISLTGKLNYANFCRERLCPMCSWRKELMSGLTNYG